MFSRKELDQYPNRFSEYYNKNPEDLIADNKFREKPGLCDPKSKYYDIMDMAAVHANFSCVELLSNVIDGSSKTEKKNFSNKQNTDYIKKWGKNLGALDIGITQLKPYHLYSHKGRRDTYGKKVNNTHPYAIAFTVEMNLEAINKAPQSPVIIESSQRYLQSGIIASQIAIFIRELGYSAKAHIDGNYEVVCPLVAKDAGLGELSRMGLLMTPKQGPRVRIAVITTDLPLICDEKLDDSAMIEFCTLCKKCAENCPSKSIPFDDRKNIEGVNRWQINSNSCFLYWCIAGTDCGKCMHVCPYAHPNNFLHNSIRFGIKHSFLFRRIALWMDDLFYGRRPKEKHKDSSQ
ncbi:MAG: 4Fe-4S dicluster domain-containing protein [Bacteroidales bacterium]